MKEMNGFLWPLDWREPLLGSFTDKYYDVLPAATLGAFPPLRPPHHHHRRRFFSIGKKKKRLFL